LWAESYERDLKDVLMLQSELAQTIAREIQVAVTAAETSRLAEAGQVNPPAYEAYLQGRFHWYKFTPQDIERAAEYFELALERDPDFALAHAGISTIWTSRTALGATPTSESGPRAKAAALRAIELDETLAEAHDALGQVKAWMDWDWAGAEAEFLRAIELNPSAVDVRAFYSLFLTAMGRSDEGLAQIERALELDPLNSLFQGFHGLQLAFMGRYDDAITQLQKTLQAAPNLSPAHRGLWASWYKKQMFEEALAAGKASYAALGDQEVVAAMESGSREGGYQGAMLRAAETLAARSRQTYVKPSSIAALYDDAGRTELALEWLEKAVEERDLDMINLRVLPYSDALRDDPRFRGMLRRMNLPE
jgi:tetratricopeptide (TPR) repeat protein